MPKKTLHDHHYTAKPIHDHSNRFARTLSEAFGPHAEWHVDRRSWLDRRITLIVAVLLAVLFTSILWAAQK